MRGLALCAVLLCAAAAKGQQAAPASVAPPTSVASPSASSAQHIAPAAPVSQRNHMAARELFLRGANDFEHNHLYAAEREFLRAAALDPTNHHYAISAELSRKYQVSQLVDRASLENARHRNVAAHAAFAEARRLDPTNPVVTQYEQPSPEAEVRAIVAANAPIELAPQPGRHDFHLLMKAEPLIQLVLRSFGIEADISNVSEGAKIPFDTTEIDFQQAEHLLTLATNSLFVPVDAKHVLAASDTPDHRRQFLRELTETLDCPGLADTDLADLEAVGHAIFDKGQSVVRDSRGHVVMRGTAAEIAAMNEACAEFSEGRSEVQLDVHLYEIDRKHQNDAGIEAPTTATLFNVRSEIDGIIANNQSLVEEIISEGLARAGDYSEILAVLLASGELTGTVFNSPFALFGGGLTETGVSWNSTAANMLLNSSDVKSLNQIQLRVLDREEATFLSGEKYPIITSAYSGISGATSSSVSSTTTPEVQYQDLGLALKVKPLVESPDDIRLDFDLEIKSLAGTSLDDDPVINDRLYTSTIAVHPGQSALITSVMSKQDSLQIMGIPGLSDLPGFSSGTNRDDTLISAELVVLITPHIVRYAHRDLASRRMMLSLN